MVVNPNPGLCSSNNAPLRSFVVYSTTEDQRVLESCLRHGTRQIDLNSHSQTPEWADVVDEGHTITIV